MRLLHEIAIFQTVKSKMIISLFETVRLSVSISLRNLYNSLNSIKVIYEYIVHVHVYRWQLTFQAEVILVHFIVTKCNRTALETVQK